MNLSPDVLDLLKLFIIPLCLWYFEWRLAKQNDKREREYSARKAEQDKSTKMILRGLKTLSDCQYEVIYDLKNGEHNGGLDQCMEEVSKYRAEVNDWIMEKASK